MKKFFKTRPGLYLIFGTLYYLLWATLGFEVAVGWFLIYTLADISYNYDNRGVAPSSENKSLPEPVKEFVREPETESPWIELEKELPPHEAVLAACDTYDCGWVVDSAWWNKKESCWMLTGGVKTEYAHLAYSHWRRMPKGPDGN
jgi:hypothetical protein